MKKKIYPIGLPYFSTMSLFLVVPLACLCAIAICAYKMVTTGAYVLIIPIVASLSGVIMFTYIFVCNILNITILTDEGIAITGQKIKGKIQYEEFIGFSEIKNVKLICAHINSKGQKLNIEGISSLRAHIFFEFELQNETTKLLYIEPYAKWQRKQLLAIINERTGHNFSYETLERRDESMFARKKKK